MAPDALRDADVYLSRRGTGRPIGASRTIVFGQESLCQIRTVRARVILTYLLSSWRRRDAPRDDETRFAPPPGFRSEVRVSTRWRVVDASRRHRPCHRHAQSPWQSHA